MLNAIRKYISLKKLNLYSILKRTILNIITLKEHRSILSQVCCRMLFDGNLTIVVRQLVASCLRNFEIVNILNSQYEYCKVHQVILIHMTLRDIAPLLCITLRLCRTVQAKKPKKFPPNHILQSLK